MHDVAAAPSSEQVVLVGAPVVDHEKLALVDVVELDGALVIETVGAEPVEPPEEPESSGYPNTWAQYHVPPVERAAPTPITLNEPFSMFARCPGEFNHAVTTALGVA